MDSNDSKYVYFILGGEYIKIGIAKNPNKRLKDLQTANPTKLKLIYSMPGDENLEKMLHSCFDEYREYGEWFRYEGGLESFVECFKLRKYSIGSINTDTTPSIKNDEMGNTNSFDLNGNHDKLISYLKFEEVMNGRFHSLEEFWGVSPPLIISRMAMEHKVSEQETKELIKDLFERGIIFRPDKDLVRLIITFDEIKEHQQALIEGKDYYTDEYFTNFANELKPLISDRTKIRAVQDVIKELEMEFGGRCPTNILITEMRDKHNFSPEKCEDLLRQLKRKGVIYEHPEGYLRAVD